MADETEISSYMKVVTSFSDLNTPISLLKSKTATLVLAYTFTFTFIICTFFLPSKPFSTPISAPFLPSNLTQQVQNSSEKVQVLNTKHSLFVMRSNVTSTLGTSLLKKEKIKKLPTNNYRVDSVVVESPLMKCNFYDGEWVRDESHYPLYNLGSCSLIDEQFNCYENGRNDNDYQKFKWKPKGCTLPRLNGSDMLELIRGKRLVFVGDSLNRNMWESLVCILKNSVKDQTKVYEVSGRSDFRSQPSYMFVFTEYACTLEFFVAPFLVQEWEIHEQNKSKKETLRIDLMMKSAKQFSTADILIFNTGHWWTHEKTSKGEDYYQEGYHVYEKLNVLEAFRKALTTWSRWVDAYVNPRKTHVFFRGYSSSHFRGGQWNSGGQCDNETEPIRNENFIRKYPEKMTVLESVLKSMKTQVTYLNITRMTDYRKDGHPSIYGTKNLPENERKQNSRIQDCSHWCLPGVPDAWNELLYAELLRKKMEKNILYLRTILKPTFG